MIPSTYLSIPFIESIMRQHATEKNIRVLNCRPIAIDNSASILAVLTAGTSGKMIGHFGLAVDFEADGQRESRHMVMKIKPHGDEIVSMLTGLSQLCGGQLAAIYPAFSALTGFQNTHLRELDVYGNYPSRLQPAIFGLYADHPNQTYLILMEYLEDVDLLNSAMTPEYWTDAHIRLALSQMAEWHAQHLGKPQHIDPIYQADMPGIDYMQKMTPLWRALLQNAADKFPDLYAPDRVKQLTAAIQAIPDYWQEVALMPKTLIHNDLNPRNTCFKPADGSLTFCVYDWELATYHVPQYDIVEFLCFILDADRYALRPIYLEYYRQILDELTGAYSDQEAFRRGFDLAALDFGLHRLGMYMMAHSVSPYPFLPRVVNSYFNTLQTASTCLPG